jgi:antiviral helicase SKI2
MNCILFGLTNVIVLLQHFPSNAGVWLKAAPFQISTTGVLDHVKHYFALVLVNPETKARTKGRLIVSSSNPSSQLSEIDVNAQAVPPRWPSTPESLLVVDGTYELVTVPLSSISLVSNRNIKVRCFTSQGRQKSSPASICASG